MKISVALLVYFLTFLLCFGIPAVGGLYAKKKNVKIIGLHFWIGLAVFVVAAVAYFLLLKYHLTIRDGVADYYNTAVYRVTIVSLITVLIAVLLWVFAMRLYVKRQATHECLGFFSGFGCAGVTLLGIYAFYMFAQLLIMVCFRSLLSFDTVKQAFLFEPDTNIFVLSPIWGHVSYAVAMLSLLFSVVCVAMLLNRIAKANIPFWASFFGFFAWIISLVGVIDLFIFLNMFKMSHTMMAVLCIALDLLMAVSVLIAYRTKIKRDDEYNKQFD